MLSVSLFFSVNGLSQLATILWTKKFLIIEISSCSMSFQINIYQATWFAGIWLSIGGILEQTVLSFRTCWFFLGLKIWCCIWQQPQLLNLPRWQKSADAISHVVAPSTCNGNVLGGRLEAARHLASWWLGDSQGSHHSMGTSWNMRREIEDHTDYEACPHNSSIYSRRWASWRGQPKSCWSFCMQPVIFWKILFLLSILRWKSCLRESGTLCLMLPWWWKEFWPRSRRLKHDEKPQQTARPGAEEAFMEKRRPSAAAFSMYNTTVFFW